MENGERELRSKYVLFVGICVVITFFTQVLIYQYLNAQYADAGLINTAGRQRMLSQRITKLALYIQRDKLAGITPTARQDTLRAILTLWSSSHEMLVANTAKNTPEIDSLLAKQTTFLRATFAAALEIATNDDSTKIAEAMRVVEANDLPFLMNMQRIVALYQHRAEAKIRNAERMEVVLAGLSMVLIVAGFIFIVRPSINKMRSANYALSVLNFELTTKEEQIRASYEKTDALHSSIEKREKEYRERVDEAADIIYEMDNRGYYMYANGPMSTFSGYTREELLTMHYYDLVAPKYRDEVVRFYQKQVSDRVERSQYEFPIITKADKLFWISQSIRIVFNDHGIEKIHAIARDITALQKSREDLMKSEKRFKSFADHSPVGIYELNAEGNIIYVNRKYSEISGIQESTAHEQRTDAIYFADRETTMETWRSAFAMKKPIRLEFRFDHPDKGIVWVVSHAAPRFDDDWRFLGYLGTLSDVTPQKMAFQKLSASEETYRLISTNSAELISLFKNDASLTRTFVSPSVRTILGYEPEELIGTSGFDIVHPLDLALIGNRMETKRSDSVPAMHESRIRKKDGTYIWMESSNQAFYDEQGEIIGIQSSARDITRRKAAEAEATEARVKAEQANHAKTQFLSMMSHEIRTPMNAVIGLTNFMLEEDPTERQAENLKLLKYSGENLLAIINDILDFSKIEAGRIELDLTSFDLPEMLQNIIKMMSNRASAKQLALMLSLSNDLPSYVVGDPVRINQVLINLIGNAIKFTEQGEVSLDVDVKAMHGEVCNITFAVKDTGIGIEASKLEMIFESFSQASKDTTRKFGGTGLGLAISRRLVKLMDGDLAVESTPGHGSIFYFTLSLRTATSAEKEKKRGKPIATSQAANYAVLLVEDNAVNQIVASNYLRKWGLSVTLASNGEEALEMIKQKQWDVVLMDMQMPVMDGYEATRRIRDMQDEYFKSLPVIALTASVLSDREKVLKDNGLTDYVTKPFEPEELHEKIFLYLKNKDTDPIDEPDINMETYAFSNPEDEKVLASFMAENLNELIVAFLETLEKKDGAAFRYASHKSKTTLAIINDPKFTAMHEEVDLAIRNDPEPWKALERKRDAFVDLCKRKAAQLKKRIAS